MRGLKFSKLGDFKKLTSQDWQAIQALSGGLYWSITAYIHITKKPNDFKDLKDPLEQFKNLRFGPIRLK